MLGMHGNWSQPEGREGNGDITRRTLGSSASSNSILESLGNVYGHRTWSRSFQNSNDTVGGGKRVIIQSLNRSGCVYCGWILDIINPLAVCR
jgi:hypothetical protein